MASAVSETEETVPVTNIHGKRQLGREQEALWEAERRIERSKRAERHREAMEMAGLTAASAEARVAVQIDAALEQLDEVMGDALVNVGDKILEQVEQKIAALRTERLAKIEGLRIDRSFDRGLDQGEGDVIDMRGLLLPRLAQPDKVRGNCADVRRAAPAPCDGGCDELLGGRACAAFLSLAC